MTESAIVRVSRFVIAMNGDSPHYKSQDNLEVKGGASLEQIKKFAESRKRTPYVYKGTRQAERDLDIHETNTSGTCVYMFDLELVGLNKKWIIFPKDTDCFTEFSMGFPANNKFLKRYSYGRGDVRAGAFSCNLQDLQDSAFATKIRMHGGTHRRTIRVPFYFNFVDQDLEAAPWIIANHSEHRHKPDTTHGGVHPNPLAFLSVPLTA